MAKLWRSACGVAVSGRPSARCSTAIWRCTRRGESGLSDALHGTGVRLLLVRPGFVIGRMTEGMKPAPMSSTPPQVAAATARALAKGRRTVWIPWTLRPFFVAMRLLPQWIWRRMPR